MYAVLPEQLQRLYGRVQWRLPMSGCVLQGLGMLYVHVYRQRFLLVVSAPVKDLCSCSDFPESLLTSVPTPSRGRRLLLVSPSGRKSVLMSDFGPGSPGVSNINFTLDDYLTDRYSTSAYTHPHNSGSSS